MKSNHLVLVVGFITAVTAVGCGDGGGSTSESVCDPGAVQVCPCGGGEPDGTQVCNTDGSAWGECDCGASDGDSDSDSDSDTDSDTDTDADGGPDGGEESCTGDEVWYDPATGLCWQNPPDPLTHSWDVGRELCDTLDLGGHTNWRLPTISELRSLIRGWPDTETGGACPVTDDCYDPSCSDVDLCNSAPFYEGPAAGGCYIVEDLEGGCGAYWSSSAVPLDTYWWHARYVWFANASIVLEDESHMLSIRCVRG